FPNQTIGKNYKIFVFADSKITCPACNKSFMNFLKEYVIDKPNCFIINYSSGAMYDISDLLEAKNCYNDRKTKFFVAEGYKFETSKVIIVKNDKIDTVMAVEPETLSETLQYLHSH
ncbi:MAG: hypothetical protein LBR17_06040, partial [Bacteroidales bacterium]|nr:hypothetical protein [Bacteroidales bacterium]